MKLSSMAVCAVLAASGMSISGCGTAPTGTAASSASAAAAPLAMPAEGMGRIIFYRPGGLFGYGMRPDILLDGSKIGRSVPGTSFSLDIAAGVHKVTVENSLYSGERALEVKVDSRKTVYVRTSLGGSAFGGRTNVELIDTAQATQETAGLERVAAAR